MKFVAPKAPASEAFVVHKADSSMTKEAFAKAFGATPVHDNGDDTNPFSLAQFAGELEMRLAAADERPPRPGRSD